MNRRQILASCCAILGASVSAGAKNASGTTGKPLLARTQPAAKRQVGPAGPGKSASRSNLI
jgi:hypothetical protein